ncbi:PKD domain-containing protein [Pollutibacter soli]|uniref:PKD domain-containing protein n=1 Tax=Pollutibacter soli TaxID=3034157 RepID=UPI0030137EEE
MIENIKYDVMICCLLIMLVSCNKSSAENKTNTKPQVSLTAEMTSASPVTYRFTATASDADSDPLEYNWNFGEGTTKKGGPDETFSYPLADIYQVKLSVSDKVNSPVEVSVQVNTRAVEISIDKNTKYQTMDGFGGFGAKDVYWSSGPFTSAAFVNDLINDLGLTILRDDIPTNFEIVNDNDDPNVTDLTKYNINASSPGNDGKLADHLQYLKDMQAAGLNKMVASVWSGPAWMKTNGKINNGTTQNSAPNYNPSPTAADNQLRVDMYEEFAEMCVAYIRIIKQETGIDVYALSIQNEPRFSQYYASTVYNGNALRDLLKVVGRRFKKENISTKLFLPEDIGYLDGVSGMIQPTLNDDEARGYADIIAVHGYELDGYTANSPEAQTWQTMYSWGAKYGKPLWMTETSGYKNDWSGAMALAKAMYTAIKFGNSSAWLYWSLSTSKLDEYCLMSSAGEKSKRYFVSKNFYKYVRPGAVRIKADISETEKLYTLAFTDPSDQSTTIVLINDTEASKAVQLSGAGLPASLKKITSSATDNCKEDDDIESGKAFVVKANSVVTLKGK